MIRRLWWIPILLLVVLALSGCCCCFPAGVQSSRITRNLQIGPLHQESRQVQLGDAERVTVDVQFGGGELEIGAGDEALLEGEFTYNIPDLEPEIVYHVRDGEGELLVRHSESRIQWDRSATEMRNEWQLDLTQEVPLSLDIDVGASTGRLELGGLRIVGLDLVAGAADMQVRFDEPNPERLSSMTVHSGAARLDLLRLGNANLDQFSFDGGLGTYTFDFTGEWERSAQARIQAGASQVVLRVPEDIGVRVCPGDLRSGNYGGLSEVDGCYVNPLYQRSDVQLDVDIDLGLGSLTVRQTNGK
jgi:hypothetical protein